jgi:hypothetical protein
MERSLRIFAAMISVGSGVQASSALHESSSLRTARIDEAKADCASATPALNASWCMEPSDGPYRFPSAGARVNLSEGISIEYNPQHVQLRGASKVDIFLYFEVNDAPAAVWTGLGNTGKTSVDVSVTFFSHDSTDSPHLSGPEDAFYLLIRPASSVISDVPRVSQHGLTFFAMNPEVDPEPNRTDVALGTVSKSSPNSGMSLGHKQGEHSGRHHLSRSAIVGTTVSAGFILVAASAIGCLFLLLLRRKKHRRQEKEALREQQQKDPARDYQVRRSTALGVPPPIVARESQGGATGMSPFVQTVGGPRCSQQQTSSDDRASMGLSQNSSLYSRDGSMTAGTKAKQTSIEPPLVSMQSTDSSRRMQMWSGSLSGYSADRTSTDHGAGMSDSEVESTKRLTRKASILCVSDNVVRPSKAKLMDVHDHSAAALQQLPTLPRRRSLDPLSTVFARDYHKAL